GVLVVRVVAVVGVVASVAEGTVNVLTVTGSAVGLGSVSVVVDCVDGVTSWLAFVVRGGVDVGALSL
ncbi:MAG TPA: hypothetical protein VFB19_10275, partial [Mycobacterium sp.]|nr:hypothetical protein [Mycobacterium sp.]